MPGQHPGTDQEKEGTSLQTQLQACQKHCQDKGYTVIKTFSETWSGTTLDRPQLTQLRDLVASGEANVIVIYCLDRISRDPTHGVILFQEFEKLAVRLEAVTETVESTEIGKLISYIRGFASKLEVEKIRERTTRGKTAHLKQGHLPTGTGIGAYGYQWDKATKKRVIIDEEAAVVRRIFSSLLRGDSLSQIASSLNHDGITTKAGLVWCHTTIRRTLTNPIYAGETYYGQRKRVGKGQVQAQDKDKWILLPDISPPIVDKATFDAAQEAIKRKYRPVKNNNSSYFLTGFMFCPECGSPVCGATLGHKYRYYCCRGTRPTRTRGVICNAHYIKADEVEAYVWDRFSQLVSSPYTILSMFTDVGFDSSLTPKMLPIIDKQLKALHNRLNTYEPRERKLYDILQNPNTTQEYVLDALAKLKKQKEDDQRQIEQLEALRLQKTYIIKATQTLSQMSQAMATILSKPPTNMDKRKWLESYGVRITATPGKYTFTTSLNFTSESWNQEMEDTMVDMLQEIEAKHPEMTMTDWMDYSVMLPEDHPLTRKSNEIKRTARARYPKSSTNRSYITIGQTSA